MKLTLGIGRDSVVCGLPLGSDLLSLSYVLVGGAGHRTFNPLFGAGERSRTTR